MKKIYFCLLPLFIAAGLYADTETVQQNGFIFSDIFKYDQPVVKGENEKKTGLKVAGSYTEKQGNTDSTYTTYSCSLKYDDNIAEFKIYGFGSYGKLKGVVNENKGSVTVNFDYYLFWRVEFFSYSTSDYDRITELEHRNGSGCGLKYSIIRNKYLRMDISGAPIYQYEKYRHEEPDDTWRWSLRGRFEIFPFSEDFYIKYVVFYIPEMGNSKNYRTTQDVSVFKKLVGALGVSAGYRREYNTYTREAFIENPALKKTDSMTYIQAVLSL